MPLYSSYTVENGVAIHVVSCFQPLAVLCSKHKPASHLVCTVSDSCFMLQNVGFPMLSVHFANVEPMRRLPEAARGVPYTETLTITI